MFLLLLLGLELDLHLDYLLAYISYLCIVFLCCSSMYTDRFFIWYELSQTEVHDGPFPPRSSCDDWLLRLTYIVQRGQFETDRSRFEYAFDTPQVIQESKFWINLYSNDKRYDSIENMYSALIWMDVDDRDRIVEELSVAIFDGAVPLPQLAIDVTIRKIIATAVGGFDDHDNILSYSSVRKSWAEFKAATTCSTQMPPSSCAVCLEDFGEEFDGGDKLITRLPCLHYFHGHCATRWVKTRHTCPLCRHQIMPTLHEESADPNPNGVVWQCPLEWRTQETVHSMNL